MPATLKQRDSKPLFSNSHTKQENWGTNISYNGKHILWLERAIDWLIITFTRPKMTESNLEPLKSYGNN